MRTRTESILIIMNVISWVTFIGLMVKAGALLFTYVVCIINPDASGLLYQEVIRYDVHMFSTFQYTSLVSFAAIYLILQAYVAYLVIKVLSRIQIANPFTTEISNLLEKISYYIFGTWIVATFHNGYVKVLSKSIQGLRIEDISTEFIFLAGIVFVIAQVFKRGVELQSENDLTV